jgi:hypothetical protein
MTGADLRQALLHFQGELYRIQTELNTAANRRAQYLYMGGALLGLLGFVLIAGFCALTAWALGHSIHERSVGLAFGSAALGALGATASVSLMASLGHLRVDPAAGIYALPRLGALRPSVGAIFGLALYFALRSGVVDIGQSTKSFYLFGFFAFAAGFSERLVPDMVRRAEAQFAATRSSDPIDPPSAD